MADSLDRECDVFARYLTGVPAGDYLRTKYREAHGGGGPGAGVVGPATGSFDSALVGFARSGTFATRLADAHARLFANGGLLRRKLVLMRGLAGRLLRAARAAVAGGAPAAAVGLRALRER